MKKTITKFKKGIPIYLLTFAALLFAANAFGQIFTVDDGDWVTDAATVWNTGVAPGANDDVTIYHHVTHGPGALTTGNLFIDGVTASLVGTSFDLTIGFKDDFWVRNEASVSVKSIFIDGHGFSDLGIEPGCVVFVETFTLDGSNAQFDLEGILYVTGDFTCNANASDSHYGFDTQDGGGGTLTVVGCFLGDGYVFGHKPCSSLGCGYGPLGAFTWIGRYSHDWRMAGNWNFNASESSIIPNGAYNIHIPIVDNNDPNYYPNFTDGDDQSGDGSCKDLTIAAGAQMDVNGDMYIWGNLLLDADAPNSTASFRAIGPVDVVTGTTKARVFVEARGNNWSMVSPPLVGSLNSFITSNLIHLNTSPFNKVGIFNELGTVWTWYDGFGPDVTLQPGVALMLNKPGLLEFTGVLPVYGLDDIIPIAKTVYGYNAFGNPYTASLDMIAFMDYNTGWQATGAAAWYYDGFGHYLSIDAYGTDPYSQTGQGFLMQAATGGGNLTLIETLMQGHDPATPIKSGTKTGYRLKLNASLDGMVKTAKFNFRPEMTVGYDPVADARLFGNSKFELYTKVEGYPEVNFEIQGLPDYNLGSVVLPVGLNCTDGGEVTFSASEITLPDGVLAMFLEDKENGRFTDLTNGSYTAEVTSGTSGEGRFYIHFKALSTGIEIDEVQPIKAFYNGYQEIQIEGQVGAKSTASVFDISGKLLGNYQLKGESLNIIPVRNLENGVYILRVIDGERVYKTRIPVL